MTELVKYIIDNLVEHKEQAVVTEDNGVIKVSVAKDDMGKVIGKQGKIAKAIRAIVKSACGKEDKKYSVEILEAEE